VLAGFAGVVAAAGLQKMIGYQYSIVITAIGGYGAAFIAWLKTRPKEPD
jgi:hypothetical protein